MNCYAQFGVANPFGGDLLFSQEIVWVKKCEQSSVFASVLPATKALLGKKKLVGSNVAFQLTSKDPKNRRANFARVLSVQRALGKKCVSPISTQMVVKETSWIKCCLSANFTRSEKSPGEFCQGPVSAESPGQKC